ncbi:MAG TPA: hypothetical protein VMW50_07695 [Dehalococcoidia bacterium]|nr:hypothetical protein [Dehalococcoidia bacterium]
MEKEFERDYHQDVKINKFKLPDECEQHASIYLYWAEHLANAKSDLNDAKKRADFIASETGLSIRTHWQDDDGKLTNDAVNAKVDNNEKVINSRDKLQTLERRINILSAVVSAMDHRKSELNNLTSLVLGGFYATPHGSNSGKHEGVTESAERGIRNKLNKKGKANDDEE